MATSAQLMRKVDRELVLGAGLWIVWGVGVTIGTERVNEFETSGARV
jgi:hypothetical protein